MTATPPPMQVDYEPPQNRPSNALGIASLVCGCLLCIPLLPGLAAVVLGIFGLRQAKAAHSTGKGLSIAGLILGCLNIVGWLAYFGFVFILLQSAQATGREITNRITCATNLRAIGQAMILYANEHDGMYPPDLQTLLLTQNISATQLVCPGSAHVPAPGASLEEVVGNLDAGPHLSYVYVADRLTINAPADAILLYELLGHHGQQAGGGMTVLYGDGHAEYEGPKEAARIIAGLEAGQNPPPREPLRFGE